MSPGTPNWFALTQKKVGAGIQTGGPYFVTFAVISTLLNIFPGEHYNSGCKKILEPDQKGPRCEAREESESGGV